MRILLTGASGFLGRQAIAPLLADGHDVIAAARTKPEGAPDIDWRLCDLLAPGAAEDLARAVRPECVLHLAWTAEPGKFWTDPANDAWVSASLALARACADAGARRFCGAGTSFEYDWPGDGDCREASTPLASHTPYDMAKARCRDTLAEWSAREKLSFAWARLFYFYGEHEHPGRLVASVAKALVAGEPAFCSRGLAARDYMDSRDAGAALARLALSDAEGAVNIASGEAVSVADLATRLGRIAGRPDLVRLGALPDRPDEPRRITADISRLTREVGFRSRVALDEGLANAVDFWRERSKQGR